VRCWPGCFTSGAAVEAGGGVVAHGRRLQAAVLLFKRQRERDFFLFPSPLVFSFFLSLFRLPVVIPLSSRFCFKKTSLPGFKLPLTLSFISLFHFSLWLVLSSPLFFSFFACWRLGPIYRAKGAGGVPIAVHGERPLPALRGAERGGQ